MLLRCQIVPRVLCADVFVRINFTVHMHSHCFFFRSEGELLFANDFCGCSQRVRINVMLRGLVCTRAHLHFLYCAVLISFLIYTFTCIVLFPRNTLYLPVYALERAKSAKVAKFSLSMHCHFAYSVILST